MGKNKNKSLLVSLTRHFVLAVFLATSLQATAAVRPHYDQAQDMEGLLAGMIALVISHDVAIPVGLLPLPAVQYTAEAVQAGTNIALKYLPPYLEVVEDVQLDPTDMGNPDYNATGCAVQFQVPSATAQYSNGYGVLPDRPAYTDPETGVEYDWDDRFGVLGPPTLYHANTKVNLYLSSADADIDTFDEYPQWVLLPIGSHQFKWKGATELNTINDIIAPTVMLAIGIMTELKNAKGSAKAVKKAKDGFGDEIVDEALDPEGAKRLSEGIKKFEDIWQDQWKKKKSGKKGREWLKKLAEKVECLAVKVIVKVLDKVLDYGIETLDENHPSILSLNGTLDRTGAEILKAIIKFAKDTGKDLAVDAIKARINLTCSGDDEHWVKGVLENVLEASGEISLFTLETATSFATQTLKVLDTVPPVIDIDPTPVVLEARDFGGLKLFRAMDDLQPLVRAATSDNCGREPLLSVENAPFLLPLDAITEITWKATDLGPNPDSDGKNYTPTDSQFIQVLDRLPPFLLPPPGKVIEKSSNVPLAEADIGKAVAVDLADPAPVIGNDAPSEFPTNQRTTVLWTATDGSGNASQKDQLITVKSPGSNTAPVAHDAAATTLTAESVDILLTANDVDELGGVKDPLWFELDSLPQHGEFIAPLYPFFVEDYRTKPNDALGKDFDAVNDDLDSYLESNFCELEKAPPRNFVHDPLFVQVTDAGIRYVLDSFWYCNCAELECDNAVTSSRISKWTDSGGFLGQMILGDTLSDTPDDGKFVLDRDGRLYFMEGNGTDAPNFIRCGTSWEGLQDANKSSECDGFELDGNDWPASFDEPGLFRYARVDSNAGVLYAADRSGSVFMYEFSGGDSASPVAEVGPVDANGSNGIKEDWFDWANFAGGLDVGADGSLYVSDLLNHRIHKIGPVTRDEAGDLVPGEYIGWSGKCTGDIGNKACLVDPMLQRSRGYSCTFLPDGTETCSGGGPGSETGQFDTPKYIALDPNDVLYVADTGNQRVQRLSPDGSFAGEATTSGSEAGFLLGEMEDPESIAVNSSRLYVISDDPTRDFIYVFGALPFKDIKTNDSTGPGSAEATVTYVSYQDFPNPNHSGEDVFSFRVSDGLATSDPATVTVTVDRNFRPPVAFDTHVVTQEDKPGGEAFALEADDPDGIIGKDFLGLDMLTWTITDFPEYGSLSGSGPDWVYEPDPDYYGEDSLQFRVNDGVFDSNVATVTIEVEPVNDPPVITEVELPERVGRGFPAMVRTTFSDDLAEGYDAEVKWDVSNPSSWENTGEFVGDGTDDPELVGVAISPPPSPGEEGNTFAEYAFADVGVRLLITRIDDHFEGDSKYDEEILPVEVEDLVSLGVGGRVDDGMVLADETAEQVDDGATFDYEITIENEVPLYWAGHQALDVMLEADLPEDVAINSIDISPPLAPPLGCLQSGMELNCDFGTLTQGGSTLLTLNVTAPGDLLYNIDQDVVGTVTTTSEAIDDTIDFQVTVEVLAIDTDGDGMSDAYEALHGLNDGSDDGGDDPDDDGLTNLEEYELGTDPGEKDTDGDGVDDGNDAFPNNPDETTDSDGDGIGDNEETDDDNDFVDDVDDNCPTISNTDQGDANHDGFGDVCQHLAKDEQMCFPIPLGAGKGVLICL